MASAISHLWNVSISIITPEIGEVVNLFHDDPDPKVVIIANGGNYMSGQKLCTHFSQSRCLVWGFKLPGHDSKKVQKIWEGYELGKKTSLARYLHDEKQRALRSFLNCNENLRILDNTIKKAARESMR